MLPSPPSIYHVDLERNRMYLEYIQGCSVKQYLWEVVQGQYDRSDCRDLAEKIGKIVGHLHDNEITHGDLTTSNMLLKPPVISPGQSNGDTVGEVVIIDFGLGTMKPTIEDKAVDLYVMERAFISTHADSEQMVLL